MFTAGPPREAAGQFDRSPPRLERAPLRSYGLLRLTFSFPFPPEIDVNKIGLCVTSEKPIFLYRNYRKGRWTCSKESEREAAARIKREVSPRKPA
jgi:hypothetical protein